MRFKKRVVAFQFLKNHIWHNSLGSGLIRGVLWDGGFGATTVDGGIPKQPPGMHETRYLPYQLVQDFFHQQYDYSNSVCFHQLLSSMISMKFICQAGMTARLRRVELLQRLLQPNHAASQRFQANFGLSVLRVESRTCDITATHLTES